MSKKYIDTSFTSFIKHKLHETIKSRDIEDKTANNKEPKELTANNSNFKKDKEEPKFGSIEYMAELHREFNKIWEEYDNLYGH